MNSEDKIALENKERIAEIFTFLTRYCTVQNVRPTSPARVDTSGGMRQKKASGLDESPVSLDELIGKLKDEEYVRENLRPEDDSTILENEEFIMFLDQTALENKENQKLMLNFGMYEFALYFIKFRTEDKIAATNEHQSMLKQCYRFLVRFVRGNRHNQGKLRDHLDAFLKDIDKHPLAI